MKVIIDTSSLISLVRYYLPFDRDSKLLLFFREKLANGEFVIIDEVLRECRQTSNGLVVNELSFLDKSEQSGKDWMKKNGVPMKTEFLPAPNPARFLRIVDNQLINGLVRMRFTIEEYESEKQAFLNSADCRMIIYCLNYLNEHKRNEVLIVTEETISSNDGKSFKKIPAIGKVFNINVINLPTLISKYPEIDVSF